MKLTTMRILFILIQIALLVRLYAETPDLLEIAKYGTPEAIKEALRAGADVNTRSEDGYTALMCAAAINDNPEVISVLLEAGANVNERSKDSTAVQESAPMPPQPAAPGWRAPGSAMPIDWQAIIQMDPAAAAQYLQRMAQTQGQLPGAVMNRMNRGKAASTTMPGSQQLFQNLMETYYTLRAAMAEEQAQKTSTPLPITALMWAAGLNKNPEVVRLLLKAGAEIEARTRNGWTALIFAAYVNDNPEVVLAFLNAGANAKAKTIDGKTAWDFAQDNEKLKGTPAYWKLNDARFE